MNRDLQVILLHDNPWVEDPGTLETWFSSHVPQPFVPREVLRESDSRWSQVDKAHVIVGPRQAGKSSAIWAHLAAVGKPVLFIDCEQSLAQHWCRSAPLFMADLAEITAEPVTLFFEKAQHLENAGLFLKGIVDRGVGAPVLVTGSSSFHLGAKIRESLAGRATRERLLPFSFTEVTSDAQCSSEIARTRALHGRFDRHVIFGGYPDVWLGDSPEKLLLDLVEAIILRDANDLFRIARPDAFRRLLRLAAGQVGNLVNLSEWASLLGISRDTVASYLEILESAHILSMVPPYAGGRRSELTKMPKVFFVDNGIRNQLVHNFQPLAERVDAGPTVENWVFSELKKALPLNLDLHFWRSSSKAEVDFVIDTGSLIVGIEVKAGSTGRPSIPRSARSFVEAYQPKVFFMVGLDNFVPQRIGETEIRWVGLDSVASVVSAIVQ